MFREGERFSSKIMIKLHRQTLRTFFHSLGAAIAISLALVATGHKTWAAGFAIGAVISLFSLFSLKVCVPALFYKGATSRATALLQVLFLMKLPFYAILIYFATLMGSAAAFAAFIGCTLVPCAITLEAVGQALLRANPRLARAAAMREPVKVLPAVVSAPARAADGRAATGETTAQAVKGRTVNEGAA